MCSSYLSVDEGITSGNINELNMRFENFLDIYFDANDELKPIFSELVNCPCCNKSDGKSFKQKRFNYIRCENCDMIYVSPRLKEDLNKEIHSQERYMEHYKYKLIPSIDYRRNVLAENKYKQIMNFFSQPGKVLDIGCGLGEVLSVFQENGWECTGVDFNQFAIDYAREHFGINVINKDIFEYDQESEFDLIMLWGILEHTYQPEKIVQKAYALLKKRGMLLIEVPSSESLLVRYCEMTGKEAYRTFEAGRHQMLFSRKAITEICEKSGFRLEKLVSNGLDISTISKMNNMGTPLQTINKMQKILDDSLQGDLLRVFLTKD